jgi:polyhydroxyalkanoate synthesis regulator phasin
MFDVIRKSMLAGVGALVFTEEKIKELVNEFVQKGELSQKEGESLVQEFQKVVGEQKTKVTDMVDDQVKKILKELHLVTKNDLAEVEQSLKKELAKIEKQLDKLEKEGEK